MKLLKYHWLATCLCLITAFAAFVRLYNLDTLPPSLYWEEVALGYDAYSILHTGKDHHGNPWPVVAFPSFGDNKPSGYFYAVVPFIAALGLNEWAVRLPSALAGVMTVLGIGILTRRLSIELWPKHPSSHHARLQLFATATSALSPWLTQFSRGGWEVNLASMLLLWSVITMLYARGSQRAFSLRLLGVALATGAMYTYHATRVIAPLVLLSLFCWEALAVMATQKTAPLLKKLNGLAPIVIAGFAFLALSSPILLQSTSSSTQQRFAETSILADGNYVLESNALRQIAPSSGPTQLFTHRYVALSREVLTNFFSHFKLDFLFVTGDTNPRHSTHFFGLFYPLDAVFLFLGLGLLAQVALRWRSTLPTLFFLAFWLVIGILPAALTKAAPHALRILPTAPVFFIVLAMGIEHAYQLLKGLRLPFQQSLLPQVLVAGLVIVVVGQWLVYWHSYTQVYPALASQDWQYGYREMVAAVEDYNDDQVPIFITREYGRPSMYYWFYTHTNPRDIQAAEHVAAKDQQEFLSFRNIAFINTVNEAKPGIVASSLEGYEQLTSQFSSVEQLSEVRDLRGRVVWVIARVQE